MVEPQKRYFHSGGMAYRVGNDWVMDTLYEGEMPERVLINPDGVEKKQMFQIQKEDLFGQDALKKKPNNPFVEKKPRDLNKEIDIALMSKQYQDGDTLGTLALRWHRSVQTIRNMLANAGVEIRSAGRKRKYK